MWIFWSNQNTLFFTLPQKMLIFIDVRVCELHYLYVQVKMEIYRKGKCNEFGHVSVNDLHIHYDTWPFTCYLLMQSQHQSIKGRLFVCLSCWNLWNHDGCDLNVGIVGKPSLEVNHGNFVMFKLTMQESLNSE